MALHVGHNCNPWEKCDVCGAEVEPQYRQRTDVCALCRQGFTVCRCRHQLREWKEKQAMRDKLEDAFLRLRAAANADEHAPMEDVIEVVLDRLAHAEDVQNGDDAASRVAERVMREVRKEFEDLMEAQEAEHRRQMANKEKRHAEEKQHLRDQLHEAHADLAKLRESTTVLAVTVGGPSAFATTREKP